MNKTVRRRIAEVEARTTAHVACDTCRHTPSIVLMDDEGRLSRPEQCPECGRDVPIFRILHIVGVPLDQP